MGSFGNYVGATMGGEYDDSWATNPDYPDRQSLVGPNGPNGQPTFVHLPDVGKPGADPQAGKFLPKSGQLGQIPGLTSDHSAYEQLEQDLNGPHALNWENWTFNNLQSEMEALQPGTLDTLATAWQNNGNKLKTESTAFKKAVHSSISNNWSGKSADAAAAATQQVTNTSIYDFTPSSDALASRLNALSKAFSGVIQGFPHGANGQLIDSGNFDLKGLNSAIDQFNSEYHLDGSGRLRDRSGGYVNSAQVIQQMNQIKRSIKDYQQAVQVFQDIYNPAVAAVTNNFPTLPPPPDMTYGLSAFPPGAPGTGPGGVGGPAIGPGGVGGGIPNVGGGSSGLGPVGIPNTKTPSTAQLTNQTTPGATQSAITPQTLPNSAGASTIPSTGSATPAAASTSDPSSALSSLAQGLPELGQGLASPLQQAMSAAQRAGNPGAPAGANNPGNLPKEGALRGLGSPGLKGGGGGAGGGAGVHEPSISKPAGAPSVAASDTTGRTVATGSRSGLSGAPGMAGAGAPGAGAPAAGHQGANDKGATHQPNKALRRKKNGEELIGDTEAVVPVLGASDEGLIQPDAKKSSSSSAIRSPGWDGWASQAPKEKEDAKPKQRGR